MKRGLTRTTAWAIRCVANEALAALSGECSARIRGAGGLDPAEKLLRAMLARLLFDPLRAAVDAVLEFDLLFRASSSDRP